MLHFQRNVPDCELGFLKSFHNLPSASPGFRTIVQRSLTLTLVISACLWLTLRDFFVLPALESDGYDASLCITSADDAIEALTREIDALTGGPQAARRLAELYRTRGSFWLQKHDLQKAIADFDMALNLDADERVAKYGRAECYRQLGDAGRADAEMQEAAAIDLSDAFPGLKPVLAAWNRMAAIFSTAAGAWLLTVIAWSLLVIYNAIVGWRPAVEASASLRRLAGVAAGLASLQVLPAVVWAIQVSSGCAPLTQGWLAVGLTLFCMAATAPMLLPPVRLRGTSQKLPRVDDGAFLSRIAELAGAMHLPPPLVRLWPSATGAQAALAFAGCLPAPQLVVTDGILHRLSPAERDAVVAHELGHLANGSLWLLTAVIPVTCALAIAVSPWFPLMIVLPFGLALGIGLRRMVCRPLELDADLRAARAAGFRAMATALAKVHAVNSFGDRGVLPLLIHATATHPSREARLWSLRNASPAGDDSKIVVDQVLVRRHQVAARAVFLVWLLVLAGTMAAGCMSAEPAMFAVPLWVTVVTPTVLRYAGQWRRISLDRQRLGRSSFRPALVVVALLACPVLAFFPDAVAGVIAPLAGLEGSPLFVLYPLLLAGVSIAGGTWMQRIQLARKLRGEMAIAMQVHDFQRVLDIGRSAPAALAADPWLRYNIAFARAICGDRTEAIAEFDELWRDQPGFPISAMTLAALLLDADEPDRALAAARGAAGRLPHDSTAQVLVARSLRRLGRLNEARHACELALALDAGDGAAHAVAAALALDDGDCSHAQKSIETALDLAPGAPYIALVRAEITLKTQTDVDPQAAFDEAIAVIRSNPFAFYRADVGRLEQILAERRERAQPAQ
jgi:Zn-dependent protease with chaperone function/Tfp pilus assembly protein PilF